MIPLLLGLGVALAAAPAAPDGVDGYEILRRQGTWQWVAVPLDQPLARGEAVLVSACGDRRAGGADPAALRTLAVPESVALAALYAQASPATLPCLDPALLGLQRACPADLPDPAAVPLEAAAVEAALVRWGSVEVARAITALPGHERCGASFRAVVPAALEAGLGAGPAQDRPPEPAAPEAEPAAEPVAAPGAPVEVEAPPTLAEITAERGVDPHGLTVRKQAAIALEYVVVERLEAAAAGRPADPGLRDGLLRLADAYLAEGSARFAVEGNAADAEAAACADAAAQAAVQATAVSAPPPCDPAAVRADHGGSRVPRQRGIELLALFGAIFPEDPHEGDVLALLGSALDEEARALEAEGRADEARLAQGRAMAASHRLLRDHPTQEAAHKLSASLGLNGWARTRDLPSTRLALVRAMEYPPSKPGLHAAVELARIARSQQQPRLALDWLRRAVARARADALLGPQLAAPGAAIRLREEYEQMIGAWGDLGALDEAWSTVHAEVPDPELRFQLLRGLARWQPAGEGSPRARFDDQVLAVHERLVAEYPTHPEAPRVLVDEATLLRDLARYDEAAAVLTRAIDLVRPGSTWAQAMPPGTADDPGPLAGARDAVENEARTFVEMLDKLSADPQTSRGERRRFGGLAIEILSLYVEVFPDTVQAPEAGLALADRLSEREDHARAWPLYTAASQQLAARGDPRAFDATRLAFLAAEGWTATELRAHPRAAGADATLIPAEQALVAAAEALFLAGRQPAEGPGWMLRVALHLRDIGQHEPARTWFLRLAQADPDPALFEAMVRGLEGSFVARGDWAQATVLWDKVAALPGAADPAVAPVMTEVQATARVEDARLQLEAGQGSASRAADLALQGARDLPAGALRNAMLRNAALWLRQSSRIAEEIEVRHRLVFEIGVEGGLSEAQVLEQLAELAVACESSSDWERAAATWESVARRAEDASVALLALGAAKDLRLGLEQPLGAARDLGLVLEDARQGDEVRLTAARELAAVLTGAGMQEKGRSRWEELRGLPGEAPGRVGIRMVAALELWRLDRAVGRQDDRLLDRAWADWIAARDAGQTSEDLRQVASELALARLEALAREVARVSLVRGIDRDLPQRRFDAALAERLRQQAERVEALRAARTEVQALGIAPHVVRALVLWGDVQQELAVALLTSARPRYLQGDQVAFYLADLDNRAFLRWSEAWEAYGLALQAAEQASAEGAWAWGAWTTRARTQRHHLAGKLGEPDPGEPGLAEDLPPEPFRWATPVNAPRLQPEGLPTDWQPPPNREPRRRRGR